MSETKEPNDEIEEYQVPTLNISKDIKDKLDESGKKYPIWNPKKEGETVSGTVDNVEFLEHLNDNVGGYLVRMQDNKGNKFVIFPNVVMTKKLSAICNTGSLTELTGKKIFIQYDKEQQPKDVKMKPYKTYSVIEE